MKPGQDMTTDKDQFYQYTAFISYSRKDAGWAKWLQGKLEKYTLPGNVKGKLSSLPDKPLRPVFLDQSDIGVGSPLRENLAKELKDARYLIVICSPDAARSEWVNAEVENFISYGRADRIIPFIVAGSPVPVSG